MQTGTVKKKGSPKVQPIRKPFLRGEVVSGYSLRRGLMTMGLYLASIFVGLMISVTLSAAGSFIRAFVNGVVMLGIFYVYFNTGASYGENDVNIGEIAQDRLSRGLEIPAADRKRCYHPLKGFFSACVGALPFVLVAAAHAFTARLQQTGIGTLPGWVTAFEDQAEVRQALSYYHQINSAGFTDFLHIAGRVLIFPYANMAGSGDYHALLLLDRISPLLLLLPALLLGLGYLTGPSRRAIVHGSIAANLQRHERRQNRERRQRARTMRAREKEKKELI